MKKEDECRVLNCWSLWEGLRLREPSWLQWHDSEVKGAAGGQGTEGDAVMIPAPPVASSDVDCVRDEARFTAPAPQGSSPHKEGEKEKKRVSPFSDKTFVFCYTFQTFTKHLDQ